MCIGHRLEPRVHTLWWITFTSVHQSTTNSSTHSLGRCYFAMVGSVTWNSISCDCQWSPANWVDWLPSGYMYMDYRQLMSHLNYKVRLPVLQRACLASQTYTSRYMCPGSTPLTTGGSKPPNTARTTAHPHTHLLLNVVNGEQVHPLHQIKLGHHSSHVIRFSQFDTNAIKSYRQRKKKNVCVATVFGSSDLHWSPVDLDTDINVYVHG